MTPEKSIGLEIGRTNSLLRSCFRRICMIEGVDEATGRNGVIIGFLFEHRNDTIHQKDIEEHFSLRRSTASIVLAGLEKNGYIIREADPMDARHKKLRLTHKGMDRYASITSQLVEKEFLFRNGIEQEELDKFFEVLRKIQNNVKTYMETDEKKEAET